MDRLQARFVEKNPALSDTEAQREAARCLYCFDAPCIRACPTSIDVPTFIRKIHTRNLRGSARTILQANLLGASCARVCPVEVLCEGACVYTADGRPPIAIGRLQRYAMERGAAPELLARRETSGRSVGLVGAGPASLACAGRLSLAGHHAVIYEKRDQPGGLNTTGVASYKLSTHAALREVDFIRELSVEIRTGVTIGEDVSAGELLERHDAVFLGPGLGPDSQLGVPGEEGPGVVGAVAWIESVKDGHVSGLDGVERALVVGGGNTAVDAARALRMLGVPSVQFAYRRGEEEMRAYDHELWAAKQEGAIVLDGTAVAEVLRQGGRVQAVRLVHTDSAGNATSREIARVPMDLVVLAIGQARLTELVRQFPQVELTPRGRIVADERTGATGHPRIFAGGDARNGGMEVVNAVAEGQAAADAIDRILGGAHVMADLSVDFAGIRSPNPFWLASGPPTNSGGQVHRAFEAGWGGAVWKTLGEPVVNVSSRLGGIDHGGSRLMGLNNIELITDRPLSDNLREIAEVKREWPDRAVVVSLMVDTREEWADILKRCEDTGCDGVELNFGCPHGMCERGMGSAVGQEPKVLRELVSWVMDATTLPVIAKLTPNVTDILDPARAAQEAGAHAVSLINTVQSVMGVDLERLVPLPRVGDASSHGGYCGPAVRPVALRMVAQLGRDPDFQIPISGIGGIEDWRGAAEFLALGAANVQVCTAVMHRGFRLVDDMIEGLSEYLDSQGLQTVGDLTGRAVPGFREWGDLDLNYHVVAEIREDLCIGCQLCHVACHDGAHQCIHLPGQQAIAGHVAPRAAAAAAKAAKDAESGGEPWRVPWVDETECVGCNLCALVCPVDGCIEMAERRRAPDPETWNERVKKGTDHVPGGLGDL